MTRLDQDDRHFTLDRRHFLRKLSQLAGASAAVTLIERILTPGAAQATIVAEDDPRLRTGMDDFRSRYGRVSTYFARPRGAISRRLGILVLHDDRGLDEHVRNVARRLATEGFVAFAPDFLWQSGGTPDDPDKVRELLGALDQNEILVVANAGVEHLVTNRDTLRVVGAIGLGWGGALANRLATRPRDLAGVVSYYGQPLNTDLVTRIRTPLMQHYAALDERLDDRISEFRQALDKAGVDYTMHIYEGAERGFDNPMAKTRYDKEAAEIAWTRTVDLFKDALNSD